VPTRNQPAHRQLRDNSPLQPVKRVPDGDQLEVAVGIDILGPSRNPTNIVDTVPQRFRTSELDVSGS
jgi:hypothetical protein